MKLRAARITFGILFLFLGLTASSRSLQGQSSTPEQQQPPQPDETPQQPSAVPSSSPGSSVSPALTPSPEKTPPTPKKASAPPKPPLLKHKRHKDKATTTKQTASGQKSTAQKLPDGSSKTVVKNGGTSEESAQLSPAVAPDQAQHQRASTADLLAATDANLKRVTARKLTTDQQNTLEQIRTYMRQAKAAAAAGDTNRAQTLAYKARLLSDDLAGK